jgi:hypothetical protein
LMMRLGCPMKVAHSRPTPFSSPLLSSLVGKNISITSRHGSCCCCYIRERVARLGDDVCVCEQAKDTFFFFSFFPSFKKVSHIVRVRCQQSYCVYHSTYSFFFILSNPPSLFWSVGRAIGFRWWMVREEAQHRQVTLLFSYILTGRERGETHTFFFPP